MLARGRVVSPCRRLGFLIAVGVAALSPHDARAVSDADELCAGDPCVITGTYTIDPYAFLDFGDRAVRLAGVLYVGSGSVSLLAGSLRIEAGGAIQGASYSAPGGTVDIDVIGDVEIEGTSGIAVDLRGAPGGALAISAGGTIRSARPLAATGRVANPYGGSLTLQAGESLRLDGALDVHAESSAGGGGSIWLGSGLDLRVVSVDANGGAAGGGELAISAGRDVRLGPVSANGVATAGPGGEVGVDAGRSIFVTGAIDALGATSGGDGGSVVLVGDSGGGSSGSIEILGPIRVDGRGTDTCGGAVAVDGGSVVSAAAITATGTCGGTVELFAAVALRFDPGSSIDVQSDAGLSGGVRVRSFGSITAAGALRANGGSWPGGAAGPVTLEAGGAITVSGTIDANARISATTGGDVTLDACDVITAPGASVRATGAEGAVEIQAGHLARLAGTFAAGASNALMRRVGAPPASITGAFSPALQQSINASLEPCAYAVCGDRLIEAPEECDDGNATSGDGCSWSCRIEHGPCNDGIDDDRDGLADFPADPGCQSITSPKEDPACDDGVDNDLDGRIDWDGSPPDPDCVGKPWRDREVPKSSCGLGAELALLLGVLAARRSQ